MLPRVTKNKSITVYSFSVEAVIFYFEFYLSKFDYPVFRLFITIYCIYLSDL